MVLDYLTHDKNVPYEEYIDKICENIDAMMVKLADLTDNLDQNTLDEITEKDEKRFVQYEKAKLKIMQTLLTNYPDEFKNVF